MRDRNNKMMAMRKQQQVQQATVAEGAVSADPADGNGVISAQPAGKMV